MLLNLEKKEHSLLIMHNFTSYLWVFFKSFLYLMLFGPKNLKRGYDTLLFTHERRWVIRAFVGFNKMMYYFQYNSCFYQKCLYIVWLQRVLEKYWKRSIVLVFIKKIFDIWIFNFLKLLFLQFFDKHPMKRYFSE